MTYMRMKYSTFELVGFPLIFYNRFPFFGGSLVTGTARVAPAVARPLAAAPAGSTSAVPGVAAQTTTGKTA